MGQCALYHASFSAGKADLQKARIWSYSEHGKEASRRLVSDICSAVLLFIERVYHIISVQVLQIT